jgi:chromosome partitioning protein
MSREQILRSYIENIRGLYDYILIDCMPSLGILTVNALACADSVLIPVQAAYLPVKGLQQLIKTVYTVKRRLNSRLSIEGILFTMVDRRTVYAKEIVQEVNEVYGKTIPVFPIEIPVSVRASETSQAAKTIYDYDPKGKAAAAYHALTQEVLEHGC